MDALNELHVWQRSKDLAVSIYKLLFSCKDRGFKDQLTRACISIPSNIAEGYERHSKKRIRTLPENCKGLLCRGKNPVNYRTGNRVTDTKVCDQLIEESLQISKMLQGLIKHCSKNE